MTEKMVTHNRIEHVRGLLNSGKPDQALQYIDRNGQNNQPMVNARGVCLMRLGRVEAAVEVLRDLTFHGLVCIPSDTPPLYQANYATALLMKGYTQEALEILASLAPNQHPYIAALYETVAEWKKTLNVFLQLSCRIKLYPSKRIPLKYPPGDL